jgi:acyl-CoA oxidase
LRLRAVRRAPAPRRSSDAGDRTAFLYGLSREERAFRERVKALLAEPLFVRRDGLTLHEQAQQSYSRFRRARDALDLRVRDVEERPRRLAEALGLIGIVDATLFTVMSIHYCLCGGTLLRHARSPQIARYIDELDSLETVGAFLVTELGFGNNVISLQTRADYDPERRELVVSTPNAAARKFMPNTALDGVPKLGIVMARLFVGNEDHGVFPVIVRLRTVSGPCAGVGIAALGDKPSFALDNAMTSFEDVRVPKHCLLLGEESALDDDGTFRSSVKSRRARFLASLEQVQLGRLCLSAVAAAATGASAFIAIRYAEQRKTFAPRRDDVAVIEYRNHQRDVFSALAYAYAARTMLSFALDALVCAGPQSHDALFRITGATKTHVTYATERFVRICRERCGAAGLFEENRLSAFAAQAQGLVTAEGDNHIVLVKVARQMLLGQGYTRLEKQRATPAPVDDPRRLLVLLRERERKLLDELERAMLPAKLPRADLFALWNHNINLALEVASAHASRLVAEAFWSRVEAPERDPVVELFVLFALSELAPHLGFYLSNDLLTRDEVKRFGALLDGSCEALHPHASELSRALDLPNTLLRAPIASDDYVAAYDARARYGESDAPNHAEGATESAVALSRWWSSAASESSDQMPNEPATSVDKPITGPSDNEPLSRSRRSGRD